MDKVLRIGDVFPSDKLISKWVMGLSLILNDFTFVERLMLDSLNKNGKKATAEKMYLVRIACSHYREAAKFFGDSDQLSEIQGFIVQLSEQAQHAYKKIMQSITPWEDSFVKTQIIPIRNLLFHYPSIKKGELSIAMIEVQDMEMKIEGDLDVSMEFRALFADEVIYEFFRDAFGATSDDLFDFTIKITDLLMSVIVFANDALKFYLQNNGNIE